MPPVSLEKHDWTGDQRPQHWHLVSVFLDDGYSDFLNFCEAAGFLGVPDFISMNPQDMAILCNTSTVRQHGLGARRLADGHPQPII